MEKQENISYLVADISDLIPYANNSRTHSDKQISQIAASIKEFGFTNPVLIGEDNVLIAGHGRILAAQKIGLKKIPTMRISGLSASQRRALVLADNRLALSAGWDEDLVSIELQSLLDDGYDLAITGFEDDEIAAFLDGGTEGQTDPDDVPEPPDLPVTVLGDVWILGNHRLLCGDSTSLTAVETLMDGQKADMLLTDPPYNVAYEGKTKEALTIQNDEMSADGFRQFLRDALGSANAVMRSGAPTP